MTLAPVPPVLFAADKAGKCPLAGGGTAGSPEAAVKEVLRRRGCIHDLKHNVLISNKLNIVRNLSIKQIIHPI
jgi:hypothetical protein